MLKRDGYFDNVPTGTDFNNRNRWNTRADLLIETSEASEVRIIAWTMTKSMKFVVVQPI